jgi:hypothetical protein
MRSCILTAVACMLIPTAALAQEKWQRTSDNLSVEPTSPTLRIGPGHHVVEPKAAILRASDGGGFHIVGPTAALLRLFNGGGFHLLGPKAAPSGRPGGSANRRGSAE